MIKAHLLVHCPFKTYTIIMAYNTHTLTVGHTAYTAALWITAKCFSYLFPCESDYVWLPVSGCGHACVRQCSELNEMWRWVSGEPVLEWAGLMCSQRTASDPSSACLNRAPGFIQRGVYLQYGALYKSLLHRRPLQRSLWELYSHMNAHANGARHLLLPSRPVRRAKLGTKL